MNITNVFLVTCLFLCAKTGHCNSYPELDLQSKTSSSDLVLIATVESISQVDCETQVRCARLTIQHLLKGTPEGPVDVLFDGPIAEFNPECCKPGSTYLFFLKKSVHGRFQSVNGRFSVYPIDVEPK